MDDKQYAYNLATSRLPLLTLRNNDDAPPPPGVATTACDLTVYTHDNLQPTMRIFRCQQK
jgi:hypothetical protein